MNLNEVEVFTLDIVGETTGEKFFGTFECLKRLSHRKTIS